MWIGFSHTFSPAHKLSSHGQRLGPSILLIKLLIKRMQSSRMRTGRSLTICRSLLPGGDLLQGGLLRGGGVCSGVGGLVSALGGGGVCSQGGLLLGGWWSAPGGVWPVTNAWDLWNFHPKDHIIGGSNWDYGCVSLLPSVHFFYFLFHPVLGDNG